ncbi:glioma pathogenesis-related protein 1 [Nelusetta ayraudi]|uniref:glioma pathogenesis-related protein 1 n=1 Tax=Nelusetta ayraudi TaxID=303726 RepID=UPI003F702BED
MRGASAAALLWSLVVLGPAWGSASVPDITQQSFIDECVKEHNVARSSVRPGARGMKDMSWDDSLARVAKAWAEQCMFEHNPKRGREILTYSNISSVGENIWMGTPASIFSVEGAIKQWVDEKQQYNYESNTCSGVCGHYKQVVWATSDKLGCSAHLCRSGVKKTRYADKEGVIFVCNYAPAGNIVGQRPYVSAVTPCTDCKDSSLRSTGDQDITVTSSDVNYTVILIVRPLALVATFLTAYAVRLFYPNVFCYE